MAGTSYTFQRAVRAPFVTLVTPQKVGKKGQEKGDPVYSLTVLIPQDSPDLTALKAKMRQVALETWPGRDLKELKFPIENGNTLADQAKAAGKDGEFFRGMAVFRARSGQDKPPALAVLEGKVPRDLSESQRLVEGKSRFYNGCYLVPSVWLAAYKKGSEGGIGEFSGVKAYVASALFVKDGPRIGGSTAAETFKAYAGTVTDEDPTAGAADDDIPF